VIDVVALNESLGGRSNTGFRHDSTLLKVMKGRTVYAQMYRSVF